MKTTTISIPKESIFDAPYRALTIGIILAVTTVAFEGLAVTTIAPKLAQQLNGIQLYGWIFTAFMLAQIIGTMVMGKQVDKRGVVQPFIWAIAIFVVGIVIAALSFNMLMLIVGRAFQGFGAGSIITCVYYSITLSYPDKIRTKILAAFSSAYILPALIGPYIAGLLAEFISWRFVFWFVLPLIGLAVLLTLPSFRSIQTSKRTPARKGGKTELYAILLAAGTGLLLTGLGAITEWKGIALAIVGMILMLRPLRHLLPEGSFRVKRGLAATIITRGLYFACYIAAESYVVLAFTELKGYTADIAGLIVAAGSLAWSFAAWLQSKLDEKDGGSGREKRVIVGIGIMIIGIVMVLATVGWSGGGIMLGAMSQVLAGFGIGFANPTTGAIALQHASHGKEGEVSSNIQFIDAFGPGLGIGIGGALIAISESLDWGIYTGIMLAISIQLIFLLLSFTVAFRIKTRRS
ncbi:MFS transporter [Paenibacillus spongiae]|uniref:MFS transporter n=1 Tax=Paenibacillus spongiae TaxID=2909671 RepID=A0ABY5S494_9BACL|nr:MFS transporter [Paenibacillus spongiae]UVI28298.1 MFS transporter [Paenibacillus spongiae]